MKVLILAGVAVVVLAFAVMTFACLCIADDGE